MKGLFIDSSIIIDLLTDRKPSSQNAARLFSLIDNRKVKGYTSAICISNVYHILSRFDKQKSIRNKLKKITRMVGILKADNDIIKSALSDNSINFEDAINYYTTMEYKSVDLIITNNINNYKDTMLPVMSCETFIKTFS